MTFARDFQMRLLCQTQQKKCSEITILVTVLQAFFSSVSVCHRPTYIVAISPSALPRIAFPCHAIRNLPTVTIPIVTICMACVPNSDLSHRGDHSQSVEFVSESLILARQILVPVDGKTQTEFATIEILSCVRL